MEELNRIIWLSNIALLALLAIRFVWTGLHQRYRAFFFLVCLQAIRYTVFEVLGEYSHRYFWFWLATEPILAVTYILAVFEVYALALKQYQGLKTISSRLLTLSIVVASVISMVSILPDLQFSGPSASDYFLITNVIRRGVYTSLLAFLILLVSFITVFPVRLSRNSIVHVVLFTVSFLCNAATILAMNLQGSDVVPIVNAVTGVIAGICYLSWILLVTPAGEHVESAVRSGVNAEEAKRLLRQLEGINSIVTSTRKNMT